MSEFDIEYNPISKAEAFRKQAGKWGVNADTLYSALVLTAIDTPTDTLDKARLDELKELTREYVSHVGYPNLLHIGKGDRKSTRLNSSHVSISYAVFCLKKKRYTQNMQF